jgi:hypothetical protein
MPAARAAKYITPRECQNASANTFLLQGNKGFMEECEAENECDKRKVTWPRVATQPLKPQRNMNILTERHVHFGLS